VGLTVNLQVTGDAKLQRDDWRGAAAALGPASEQRAVVVTRDFEKKPLRIYAGSLPPLPSSGARVAEVVTIGATRGPAFPEPPAPGRPGAFKVVYRKRTPSYELIRYRSPVAVPLTPRALGASRLGTGPAAILLQRPAR
jgi:hypothetical protein